MPAQKKVHCTTPTLSTKIAYAAACTNSLFKYCYCYCVDYFYGMVIVIVDIVVSVIANKELWV